MANAQHTKAQSALISWFAREGRDYPWRQTRDRWWVLVSEVCLQQTQVDRALPYIERILGAYPAPADLAAAPLADLLRHWQGLGYPRRARNLHAAAQMITRDGWPSDYTALPGVGTYTAEALRCFADGERVMPTDINTRRVGERLFGGAIPNATAENAWLWGQAVMELGQRYCKAKARCAECPVDHLCPSRGTTQKIASRPQARYEGSMRQRRGDVLRALHAGAVVLDALDDEAVASLLDDQLISVRNGVASLAD